MTFLLPIIKNDSLPPTITLVNDEYPIDCVLFRTLLDPRQERYSIEMPQDIPDPPQVPQVIAPGEMSIRQIKNAKYHSTKGALETPAQSQLVIHTTSPSGNKISQPPTTSEECQSIKHQTPMKEDTRASIGNGDDLDKMIEASLKVKHLPLDDDDEDSSRPPSSDRSEGSGSSEEEMNPRTKKTRRRPGNTGNPNRTAICCMTGGTGITLDSNPNKQTILILEEMNEYYSRMKDEWRTRAYRQAVGILKKQTQKISTYDEARGLPMIGDRLAKKIEEIALTNRLRRLDNTKLDPADQTLQMFTKIYNVGFEVASRWVQAGFKTLDDLKAYAHLTPTQRIGIEHYDDFNTRIPRSEVTALGDIVKKAVTGIDSRVSTMIMGSYRRGAAASGDIDIMLTLDGTTSSDDLLPFFRTLIAHLTKEGFLVASLAESRSEGGSKWHGACVLPGSSVWRRIDFLLVPSTEVGAALIYFTGDDIFNRSIRLLSSRKGMRLNQRGLFKDIMRGPGRVKLNEGTLVEGADEKKIFEILGVPWRPPEQRIIR
jgi:DNA polymerase IV